MVPCFVLVEPTLVPVVRPLLPFYFVGRNNIKKMPLWISKTNEITRV